MRVVIFIFVMACILGCYACGHTSAGTKARSNSSAAAPDTTKFLAIANSSAAMAPANSNTKPATDSPKFPESVDFSTQIKPMLEARCQPCHFSGGKVYQRMPFDRPETIRALGTKLFTRIKDENERRLIRDFLAQ
jgi:uncharacterized membrane protein